MLFGGLLGNQEDEQEAHRTAVGESKEPAWWRRMKAPVACLQPLDAAVGMAMPWPRPVEPSFSRAKRLSKTTRGRCRRGSRKSGRRARTPLLLPLRDPAGHGRREGVWRRDSWGKKKTKAATRLGCGPASLDHVVGGLVAPVVVLNLCLYFWTWRSSLSKRTSMEA